MGEIRALVLDFDGLIVESEEIKDSAFAEVFAEHAEHQEEIRDYLARHRHVVRYAKFRHVAEAIVGQPYTQADEERIGARYAELTRRQIIGCPFVRGAREFLDFFLGRVPMYLASVTPQAELEHIVRGRELEGYFRRLFGAPSSKPDVLREVMRLEGVGPDETMMVGDSYSDMNAAREAGTRFVGRNRQDDFSNCGCPHFDDLFGAREYIARLV